MSKETSNNSFNERPSSAAGSGMLGLSNLKPKLQPVRIKALLENYTSDEEDSEDRGKDSSAEEDEDLQPLPHDDDKKPYELCLTSITEQSEMTSSTSCTLSKTNPIRETITRVKSQNSERTFSRNLEQNFSQNKQTQEKHKAVPVFSESIGNVPPLEHEELKSLIRGNRRSNIELEVPQTLENLSICTKSDSGIFFSETCSTEVRADEARRSVSRDPVPNEEKRVFPLGEHSQGRNGLAPTYSAFGAQQVSRLESKILIPESQCCDSKFDRAESSARSSGLGSKAETIFPSQESVSTEIKLEPVYVSQERHHSAPETYSHAPESQPSAKKENPHQANDTPMKNNPPPGSMRPTPSTSHRSIFQTPRNSKLHQDYSQNHVQTPATIFGNWSQNHMVQTPLRSSESCEPIPRPRAPPLTSSQALSSHDVPLFTKVEEKKARRPLAETSRSSRGNQRSESENLSARYNRETLSSSKSFENHNRPVCERGNENRFNESATHESKENRHPPGSDKSSHPEESSLRASESNKETILTYSNQSHNENPSNNRISNGPTYEQHPSSFRVSNPIPPVPTASEKKNIPERQNNVQISVPGRTRRANPGQTIIVKDKEYLILGMLGEGMSGQVLRVQELSTLSLRAIKIVDLSRLDKDCAQGCLEEISMLGKLQAPSIVRMFDHEIKYPMVNVVMEMGDTDLKSLLNAMSAQKRLPLTMILYYWTEMLTAVKHIHDHGVIHSDLKPANFLLVRGRLKLIDFGIASSMNADMTSVVKNSPIGTLNYISPEALMDIGGNNEDSPTRNVKYKISFKSDVWSLGCILYSLVYGYTPFHNIRAQWAKIHAITNPKPNISFAPPTGVDVEPTPPILIDVMRKCLRHDPKARPTVGQLLQIPYIPIKPVSPKPTREIPPNILMKIKYALTESEWRLFTEVLEDRGNQ